MKKILLLLFAVLFITGCDTSNSNYSGKVSEASKKYLDKGYYINIFRDVQKLSEDEKDSGKGYIRIGYNVLTDYTSTHDVDPDASYNIKKKIVSNIRVIKGPKKGVADELYGNFSLSSMGDPLLGTNNKFETEYDEPHSSGVQSSVIVFVNKIALLDAKKYVGIESPPLSKVYEDLGITKEDVTITLGFRVELITNDNKTFYKDYEVEMPTKDFDLTGDEFQINLTVEDVNKMEPFLEK